MTQSPSALITSHSNARNLAFQILHTYTLASAAQERLTEISAVPKADEAITAACKKHATLSSADKHLITQLIIGTLRWWFEINQLLTLQSKRPVNRWNKQALTLARLAFYQLIFLDRIPDYAAVDSTLKLAKLMHLPKTIQGFLNGNLRQFIRTYPDKSSRKSILEAQSLSIHEKSALFQHLHAVLETEHYQAYLQASKQLPPVTVRINTLKTTPETVLELLPANCTATAPEPGLLPEVLLLNGVTVAEVLTWPLFTEGSLYIQDLSSAWVVALLAPQPGDIILDACCAPGSKTTHIAQKLAASGHITGIDLSDKRLEKVRENIDRLGLPAKNLALEAAELAEWCINASPAAFDRILLDAPCSAIGTVKRHPELALRLASSDFSRHGKEQLALLQAIWPLLKPGGRLVYSTCSNHPDETDKVIDAFLKGLSLKKDKPVNSIILQHRWPTSIQDGFFAATLHKAPL